MQSFVIVKEKLINEINAYNRGLGLLRIYQFLMNQFDNDHDKVRDFMIQETYDAKQINTAKAQFNYWNNKKA